MISQLHFIAGLPRSGSTLLAAILRQNPDIYTSITSPVASLFDRLMQSMSARSDYAEILSETKRLAVLRGLFDSYYADVKQPIITDTHRHWCSRMAALAQLFPDSKVICCVREPCWIVDSFERLYQASPLLLSRMFSAEQAATVHTRVEALTSVTGVVGFAYDAFAEAFYGAHRRNLIVIDYDAFTAEPGATMTFLYAALGLGEPYKHRFDQVPTDYPGEPFDRRFGIPDLHRVRPHVVINKRDTILPPELFKRFTGRAFWRVTERDGT